MCNSEFVSALRKTIDSTSYVNKVIVPLLLETDAQQKFLPEGMKEALSAGKYRMEDKVFHFKQDLTDGVGSGTILNITEETKKRDKGVYDFEYKLPSTSPTEVLLLGGVSFGYAKVATATDIKAIPYFDNKASEVPTVLQNAELSLRSSSSEKFRVEIYKLLRGDEQDSGKFISDRMYPITTALIPLIGNTNYDISLELGPTTLASVSSKKQRICISLYALSFTKK